MLTGEIINRDTGLSKGVSVLVIDSRDLYRESLSMALETHDPDLHVSGAASLDQALPQLAAAGEVDVVLVTVERNAGDYPICLNGLGRLHEHANIPVLVLCEKAHCSHTGATIEKGVMGFLTPSASVGLLAGALRVVGAGGACFPVGAVTGGPAEVAGELPPAAPLAELSPKQRQVLAQICEGKSNREIAEALKLAEGTVKVHVSEILKRLKVSSRTQAVLMASNLAAGVPAQTAGP